MKHVILTNEQGEDLGLCEIIEAHTNGGKLHRAFSIFIFNPDRTKLLIQQRSSEKMLFPLLWANTCCSHPYSDDLLTDAQKRLQEELGFTTDLQEVSSFVYKADDPSDNGTEHEYDTVLMGNVDEHIEVAPDPSEVAAFKWINLNELQNDIESQSEKFAPWFPIALAVIKEHLTI